MIHFIPLVLVLRLRVARILKVTLQGYGNGYPLFNRHHGAFLSKIGFPSADYMVEHLGIEKSKITELGNLLYKNYGTTMAGLRV